MKVRIYSLKKVAALFLITGLAAFTVAEVSAAPCDTCGCSAKPASSCATKSCDSASSCSEGKGSSIVDVAVQAGPFKTLVAAVKAAGLVDTLSGKGPFTVFAPTDEAFAKIPKADLAALLKPENKDKLTAILTYHVIPQKVEAEQVARLRSAKTANGQDVKIDINKNGVFVDGAKVIKTDIQARNGVIHVIDTVIMPEFKKDIVDVAVEAGSFKTLVTAVKAAGLVDTLKGEGPFTVFAPSDAAFAKLPEGTISDLLKPENKDKLIAILTYHVLPGETKSSVVAGSRSAQTVNGQSLGFSLRGSDVYIDEAKVVQADIEAENGVIHVIDSVLIPQ
ncbi:MAG: fasciclin domain-containing protein [Planctomycetota bacterium]